MVRKTVKNSVDLNKFGQCCECAHKPAIMRTVETKISCIATKEDLAHFGTEMERCFSRLNRWMFAFWVAQLVAMVGLLHYLLK